MNVVNPTGNDSVDFGLNPICPGLFPPLDITDPNQFINFDKLSLTPKRNNHIIQRMV